LGAGKRGTVVAVSGGGGGDECVCFDGASEVCFRLFFSVRRCEQEEEDEQVIDHQSTWELSFYWGGKSHDDSCTSSLQASEGRDSHFERMDDGIERMKPIRKMFLKS
jgi:hypothetical protein